MKEFNKEEYNKMCAELFGWEYFPESKSGQTWPDGTHNGEYTVFDIWVKNPTEKYRELLCHSSYEYLGGEYNDEIKKSDLFEDYVYTLKYHSDWNHIMDVYNKIKHQDSFITLPMNGVADSVTPYITELGKVRRALMDGDKEAVVHALWKFLNWYKENK